MTSTWLPLIVGAEADAARVVIAELAAALAAPSPTGPAERVALDEGDPGVALFHAYRARGGDVAAVGPATELLGGVLEAAGEVDLDATLFGGILGVAWTLDHLATALGLDVDDEAGADLEAAARARLDDGADLPCALFDGLAGIGVFALERLPRASAAELLDAVLARLEATAQPRDGGVTWATRPEHLSVADRALFPDGYINLGMAHGVPAVIALCAAAARAGVAVDRATRLRDAAITCLLAQRLDGVSRFGYFADQPEPARAAWCYGDPAIACVLQLAGRTDEALALARHAARRDPDTTGVVDGSLCHGAAGLAHMFNRLWQATGDRELAEAARAWIRRLLAGSGAPGRGLLGGGAGIGLALLAAISTVEPAWDRVLLLSGR